jgi:hypothetical protein
MLRLFWSGAGGALGQKTPIDHQEKPKKASDFAFLECEIGYTQ